MSKWILSSNEAQKFSFRLEKTDLQISSLEELAYLMETGKLIFIEDVMNDFFCDWISQELGDAKKGESLKQMMKAKAEPAVFFQCVFRSLIYINDDKIKELMEQFADGNLLKECQRFLHKGNQFFRASKFRHAIFEYRQALRTAEEEKSENKEDERWKGKVWHNIGNCYMYELRFQEAVDCFQTAYILNYDDQTQTALLLAKQALANEELPSIADCVEDDEVDDIEKTVNRLKREVLKGIR